MSSGCVYDAFVQREAIGEVFQVRRVAIITAWVEPTIGEGNGDFLGDLAGGGGEAAGRESEGGGGGREGFMLSPPPGVKSPLAAAISPTRGETDGGAAEACHSPWHQRFCFLDIRHDGHSPSPLWGRVGEGSL